MDERHTIGHRMSRKVLVIAPTHLEAQRWAQEHGIAYSDTIYVGPFNVDEVIQGLRGVEHVILGWGRLEPSSREYIKHRLQDIESVPFEGAPVDPVLHAADSVRL